MQAKFTPHKKFVYNLKILRRSRVLTPFSNIRRRLSSSSFEGYPLQARHKQDWGRGFILLLPQTAALPGSNAGSDVIKPASSFVIQNRQTSSSKTVRVSSSKTSNIQLH